MSTRPGLNRFGGQNVVTTPEADTNLVQTNITNNGTPNVWTELLPADQNRLGAYIQNKDASAIVYVVASSTQPSSGTAAGELGIPAFPTYYYFDFIPKKRYWVRSTVASSVISLSTW